jgi:hypothetical protein
VFAVPVARVAAPEELPGERIALVAHQGEALIKSSLPHRNPVWQRKT